jgi:hypothetical protein
MLLLKPHGNLNRLLAALNQHRDLSKPVSSVEALSGFQGTDASGFMKKETYFAAEDDVVTDVLQCDPPESFPSPGCDHWIAAGTFLVKANYGRDRLPKWRDIRDTVTAAFRRCNGL